MIPVNIHDVLFYKSLKTIITRCILCHRMSFGIKKKLLHDCEGEMKIYSSREIVSPPPPSVVLRKYDLSRGNKTSYLPHHHAMNVYI